MENIKDFTISTSFILVASLAFLLFVLSFPIENGQTSVLITENPNFNSTKDILSSNLSQFQNQQNLDINISTSDEPQASAEGLYLVSSTATSRNLMGRLTESFGILTKLLGNVFGLSGGQFTAISAVFLSLFGFVILYFTVKAIRWGQ